MTRQTPASVMSSYSTLPVRQREAPASASPLPSPSPYSTSTSTSNEPSTVVRDCCQHCQTSASTVSSKHDTKPEAFTKPFCDFLTENPTVFHAVDYFKNKLHRAGYKELSSRDSWNGKIQPGGKYWTSRNGSSVIAFRVGKAYQPGNGFGIVGGHIDALTARLKPVSSKPNKAGYLELGVAPYGGALNETWWDRDLSIGGRVIVRDPDTGKTSIRLVKLGWPIAKVSTLAPHFGVGIMGQNNRETQAVPIIGLEGAGQSVSPESIGPQGSFVRSQPPKLVKLVAEELGLAAYTDIVNWELELYDSQPAQLIGLDRELISAGRIDDKLCSWAAMTALLTSEARDDDGYIQTAALFDDEEIGSKLRQGAGGNFLPSLVERTVEALCPDAYGPSLLGQTYARSFLLSADVSHAGNPNFLGHYLEDHTPKLNVGMVIACDSNGHMTTDAASAAIMTRTAELCGAKTQLFQIRNDSRSGGTIGPMLSTAMGVRAADCGMPQLGMHSIRATTGALDPGLGVQFFRSFFEHWEQIDNEWE